jgi:peptide-methionine (S)-S-oxide reductase
MPTTEMVTLGGGCFWCLEAVFDIMDGVVSVESGYMGGEMENPDYRSVCTGMTGHAEVVQVTFDPAVTTFRDVLDVFFGIHDPTTLNRQGNDVGSQYRSAIFYHSEEQKRVAEQTISELEVSPVVTQVAPAEKFYIAEDYHQEYFAKHPNEGYCSFVVAPKVAKFRKKFSGKVK